MKILKMTEGRLYGRCRSMGRQDVVDRLIELGCDAREEGVEPLGKSAADLASLVVGQRLSRPMLCMTDRGTYRAMWKGDGWQAAIHFLGDARVNFVIAHSRGNIPDRNYGSSTIGQIKRHLKASELWSKMRGDMEGA